MPPVVNTGPINVGMGNAFVGNQNFPPNTSFATVVHTYGDNTASDGGFVNNGWLNGSVAIGNYGIPDTIGQQYNKPAEPDISWSRNTNYPINIQAVKSLMFKTTGSPSKGGVNVEWSDDPKSCSFGVEVLATSNNLLDKFKFEHNTDNSTFTYDLKIPELRGSDRVKVVYTIKLPKLWSDVNTFTVNVSNMKINVSSSISSIAWASVNFSTTNDDVNISKIFSKGIIIKNDNGSVNGAMAASCDINVTTDNGHISGDFIAKSVTLTTVSGSIELISTRTNDISLQTSSGHISGPINGPEGKVGDCIVRRSFKATSNHGAIDVKLKFDDETDKKNFKAVAKSTNGMVTLGLPITYSGILEVKTKWGTPLVSSVDYSDIVLSTDEPKLKKGSKGSCKTSSVTIDTKNSIATLMFIP